VEGPKRKSRKTEGLLSKMRVADRYALGLTPGQIRSGPLDRDPATAGNSGDAAARGRRFAAAISPA
jgi:hypothetical protein